MPESVAPAAVLDVAFADLSKPFPVPKLAVRFDAAVTVELATRRHPSRCSSIFIDGSVERPTFVCARLKNVHAVRAATTMSTRAVVERDVNCR